MEHHVTIGDYDAETVVWCVGVSSGLDCQNFSRRFIKCVVCTPILMLVKLMVVRLSRFPGTM